MNKYEMTMAEMIEVAKIETIINRERQGCVTGYCNDCKYFGRHYCSSTKKAEALYDEGCRIVGEDEIVIKKSEHKAPLLEQKRLKEMVDRIPCGYVKIADDEIVIKKSEYENLSKTYAAINSEAYYCGLSVGREEAAKEILQELYDEAISYVCKVVELTTFQIEQRAKEKGIELEKDNGQRRNI